MTSTRYTVTIDGCTPEQAETVMGERLSRNEDYGFDYTTTFHRASSPGITLDAASVRDEVHDRVHNAAPGDTDLTENDLAGFNTLDDDTINDALREALGDRFWDAYDDVRSTAISRLLDMIHAEQGRVLVDAIATVLDNRDAHDAAQHVRDTGPSSNLWDTYLTPMLDNLESDYTQTAADTAA